MTARDDFTQLPLAALTRLVERSREFYTATTPRMQLDIVPLGAPQQACRLHFGETLDCSAPGEQPFGTPVLEARLHLPVPAIAWLIDNPTKVDLRNPDFIASSEGFAVTGARIVAEFWIQLLKRPSAEDAAALALAFEQAPSMPRGEDFENDAADVERAVLQAIARRTPHRIRGAVSFAGDDVQTLSAKVPAGTYTGGSLASPDVLRSVRWPALRALPSSVYSGAQVWAGQRQSQNGSLTRLHCDVYTSLLAHLEGRKQVLLFSPRLRDSLYAVRAFNTFQPCAVDARRPDLSVYPRFSQAQGHATHVELLPGDLLVIPTGWYHYVWADEPVASVSLFVRDSLVPADVLAAHVA